MLQRVQTLYMLLVPIINGGLIWVFSLGKDAQSKDLYAQNVIWVLGVFLASAALALITIYLYRNRKLQFVLNRLNIVLNLFLLGTFVYGSLSTSGGIQLSEKGVGMFLPIISIVFLVLANKAIQKDETLVKSADRLR